MKFNFKILMLFILTAGFEFSNAQSVRSLNNEGVELYQEQKFADSEASFKKGLNKEPNSFETNFNLGDTYYKQKRYDEAIKIFRNSLDKTEDPELEAKAFYNIGNSLLESKKIKESIKAFENSLKLNPNDREAKYNLSYALSLLKKQQQNNQKNNKNKDQDKSDKNKQDKNKNNEEQKKNNQDKNKPENQTAKDQQLKPQEKNKISKAEAERILEALKNNEKDLQKKLRKQKGEPIETGKDW